LAGLKYFCYSPFVFNSDIEKYTHIPN
jgi:hypothetical protein